MRVQKAWRWCAVLWSMLLLPLLAQAATYHVSLQGSDALRCAQATAQATPLRTIRAGIACLQAGDTLLIHGGTYDETLTGPWPSGTSWAQAITIASAPGETAILQPSPGQSGNAIAPANTAYLSFERLTVIDQRPGVSHIIRDTGPVHHLRLRGMTIRGRLDLVAEYQMGILLGGVGHEIVGNDIGEVSGYGVYLPLEQSVVEGNTIHDTGGYGIHLYYSACQGCVNANVIRHNRVRGTGRLTGDAGRPGCGMVIASGAGNRVCENQVEGNAGCGIQLYGTAVDTLVWNNTITNNGGACMTDASGQGTYLAGNTCTGNHPDTQPASVARLATAPDCGGSPLLGIAPPPLPAPRNLRVTPGAP